MGVADIIRKGFSDYSDCIVEIHYYTSLISDSQKISRAVILSLDGQISRKGFQDEQPKFRLE